MQACQANLSTGDQLKVEIRLGKIMNLTDEYRAYIRLENGTLISVKEKGIARPCTYYPCPSRLSYRRGSNKRPY